MNKIRIAMLQALLRGSAEERREQIRAMVEQAAGQGTDLVTLPEIWNGPYQQELFPSFAEPRFGPSWQLLSELAAEYGIWLSGGSIAEREDGKVYNTAYVFDRSGREAARHRKMHLFDIQITGGQHFMESATLTAGDRVTVFDTEFCKMGLCICYDARFPELFRLMADRGTKMVLVPAAFNMTTGPLGAAVPAVGGGQPGVLCRHLFGQRYGGRLPRLGPLHRHRSLGKSRDPDGRSRGNPVRGAGSGPGGSDPGGAAAAGPPQNGRLPSGAARRQMTS